VASEKGNEKLVFQVMGLLHALVMMQQLEICVGLEMVTSSGEGGNGSSCA